MTRLCHVFERYAIKPVLIAIFFSSLLGLPGVCPKDLASGPGTGDAGTVNSQMRGEPGNSGPPRMRVLLSVALRARRAFLGAKQRLGCLEHVLGELPVGGEQLLGEVVGAGRELLGLGQLVAVGQV